MGISHLAVQDLGCFFPMWPSWDGDHSDGVWPWQMIAKSMVQCWTMISLTMPSQSCGKQGGAGLWTDLRFVERMLLLQPGQR